ncbi:MAG: Mur ligase domain-containing protein [Planctomycetota bacterium]
MASDAWRLEGESVYMIGIGGCGMSGLARMLRSRGAEVSGSDRDESQTSSDLIGEGIEIRFDQAAGVLPDRVDRVVASAAIKPDHPEMLEADRRGVPVMTYAEALGRCMVGMTGVALAGTHGKSTTSAMLGCALVDAGIDPTVLVGAQCGQLAGGALGRNDRATGFRLGSPTIASGAMAGAPGVLIAESCEFDRSFHHHRPTIASIASVEADHLDIYGSLDAIVEAFGEFAMLLPPAEQGGKLLIAHDGAHRREIAAGLACAVETIGFNPQADWIVTFDPATRQVGVRKKRSPACAWTAPMPGVHNAMNSATAFVLGLMLGAEPSRLARSLEAFGGVQRRCQMLGERRFDVGPPVVVYDDYGHHPTEVDATLRALREHVRPEQRGGRVVCVFQPHQHSRTRFFLDEFASAFEQADVVIVPQIYFVRDSEAEKQRVSAGDLVEKLRGKGVRAMHLHPFEAIVEQLENVCRPGDLLVVMGAGPVWKVARGYLAAGLTPAIPATRVEAWR